MPYSAIYDASRDNLSCHLPIDRPGEVWTRTCKVWCSMCDAMETFWVVTGVPTNAAANKSLSEVMADAGWTYGGEDADDDFCPDCSKVGA